MMILMQVRNNNTSYGMTDIFYLCNHVQCAMFYLLQNIRLAVGTMDIYITRWIINKSFIARGS